MTAPPPAPAPPSRSDVPAREGRLRQLELLVTRKLDGLLQGDHQGLVPGGGSELGDGRPYEPGDDVRRMDWSLTARSGAPHVRTTVADRELEMWLVVDNSASLDFGTAACEKRDHVLAAAAAFGFLTARDGNRIGALLCGPQGCTVVPPLSGRGPLLALLSRLERRERAPQGAVALADALRRARLAARRRSLVVVISDLLDTGPWEQELRALAFRHDVVVAEIRDPRETQLPAVGLLTLVDPETGRRLEVQTANAKVRARFAEAARAQVAAKERAVKASGAGHLVLSTDRDWMLDVVRFVARRRRRR
ncbi:MAG TPA: DUF58 domain-containing protein [Acidimicrobiales bacterium]|nr:DUF58 domain-containing protein [Acidimicrobiales bacterium]